MPIKKAATRTGLVVLIMALATGIALAQSSTLKTLQGKVFSGSNPLSGAIVYLQDSKTNSIRSFISTSDGSYRFGQLTSDTDYQVWAQFKDAKSATKSVNAYDSRKLIVIDLHIKTK